MCVANEYSQTNAIAIASNCRCAELWIRMWATLWIPNKVWLKWFVVIQSVSAIGHWTDIIVYIIFDRVVLHRIWIASDITFGVPIFNVHKLHEFYISCQRNIVCAHIGEKCARNSVLCLISLFEIYTSSIIYCMQHYSIRLVVSCRDALRCVFAWPAFVCTAHEWALIVCPFARCVRALLDPS